MSTELSTIPKVRNVFSCTFATLPGTAGEGDMAYCTDTFLLYRWNGAAWVAITAVYTVGLCPPFKQTGAPISPGVGGGYADWSVGAGANTLYAIPFVLPVTRTLTGAEVRVGTLAAGKIGRLGIYGDSANMPGALVVQSGDIDLSATGVKTILWTPTLTGSIQYWAVWSQDGTLAKLCGMPDTTAIHNTIDWAGASTAFNRVSVARGGWAALPDPFAAGGAWSGGTIPIVKLTW